MLNTAQKVKNDSEDIYHGDETAIVQLWNISLFIGYHIVLRVEKWKL